MRQVRKPTCSLEGLSLVLCQLPRLSKRIKTGRHPQNSALNRNCATISLSASLPCNYQHNQIAEQSFSQSTHTARALLLHLVRLLRSAWAVPAFSLLWSLGRSSLGCILQHKLFSCSVKQSQEFKTSLKLELRQLWDSENHKIIEFFFFFSRKGPLRSFQPADFTGWGSGGGDSRRRMWRRAENRKPWWGGDAKCQTRKWASRVGRLRVNMVNLRVFQSTPESLELEPRSLSPSANHIPCVFTYVTWPNAFILQIWAEKGHFPANHSILSFSSFIHIFKQSQKSSENALGGGAVFCCAKILCKNPRIICTIFLDHIYVLIYDTCYFVKIQGSSVPFSRPHICVNI